MQITMIEKYTQTNWDVGATENCHFYDEWATHPPANDDKIGGWAFQQETLKADRSNTPNYNVQKAGLIYD